MDRQQFNEDVRKRTALEVVKLYPRFDAPIKGGAMAVVFIVYGMMLYQLMYGPEEVFFFAVIGLALAFGAVFYFDRREYENKVDRIEDEIRADLLAKHPHLKD